MDIQIGSYAGLCAVISDLGGTVKHVTFKGKNIIFPETIINEKKRGGIPICFPYFGKPGEAFSEMPQHGWLRDQTLKVSRRDTNRVFLVGEKDPQKQYPWKLGYKIAMSINPKNNSLTVLLEVERLKDGVSSLAPINPGFHPYFLGDSLNAPLNFFAQVEGKESITNFPLESAKTENGKCVLVRSGGFDLLMWAEECAQLVLWSDSPTKKYFCAEPVLGKPTSFNDPGSGKFLQVGEKFRMSFSLAVLL